MKSFIQELRRNQVAGVCTHQANYPGLFCALKTDEQLFRFRLELHNLRLASSDGYDAAQCQEASLPWLNSALLEGLPLFRSNVKKHIAYIASGHFSYFV